jgi:halimadienyl-diphosphate synthase
MNLNQEVRNLLKEIGPGRMNNTAYDTAWLARLGEIGVPMGEQALEWLRSHQLEDGSWGAKQPYYYHDRVICTLAAMNTLARRGRVQDRVRLRQAEAALGTATGGLSSDPAGETVGFELIVPTLLAEAKAIGGIHREEKEILKRLTPLRAAKLAAMPDRMVNRFVTVAHSAEMAGPDGIQLIDLENLQEANGSIGHSPSATAYFCRYVHSKNTEALKYLDKVDRDGAVPNVVPFDIFERAWTLWNIALTAPLDDATLALCQPHLDFLENAWHPKKGVGFAAGYTPKDGDDTGLTYEVLKRYGRDVNLDAVMSYEHIYYFRCFDLESTPSISANIHVLGALRHAGLEITHPSVQKVMNFLRRVRTENTFWFDKWHASPYYTTTQAIIACTGYADELAHSAASWLLETQNEDGSWGYYMPTAEETAYCLQALSVWRRQGHPIPDEALKRGVAWLQEHKEPPYPPLWIGKCLYCPELVVQSAILSALISIQNQTL